MSDAFKALGGKDASELLSGVDNPIAGVMLGVLATVLLQSSSTTTSILVSMVDAGAISIRTGIPMVMGANIGTTVTNTIVSFGHVKNPEELARAFTGATVHDVFNLLNVAFFLPLEVISHFLEEFSQFLIDNIKQNDGDKWEGPVKKLVGDYSKRIISINKDKLKDLASDKCDAYCDMDDCAPNSKYFFGENEDEEKCYTDAASAAELNAPFNFVSDDSESIVFSQSYSVGSDYWEAGSALEAFGCEKTKCKKLPNFELDENDIIQNPDYSDAVYQDWVNAGGSACDPDDWIAEPCEGQVVKGGVFYDWGWSDSEIGGVGLAMSLIILTVCIVALVKVLTRVMKGPASLWLNKALGYNGYLAMLIGVLVTLLVQSSSVTTSTLTPLVGIGVIDVHQMFPLTLGANVGTTGTGLLAALVSSKPEALQLAFCHLFFNVFGILLWYPIPAVRQFPIKVALWLGKTTATYRWFPFAYTGIVFVAIPAAIWGISTAF